MPAGGNEDEHQSKGNDSQPTTPKRRKRAGQELLKEETVAKLDAHHKRMMARMESQL
jgi:hypothetical protein